MDSLGDELLRVCHLKPDVLNGQGIWANDLPRKHGEVLPDDPQDWEDVRDPECSIPDKMLDILLQGLRSDKTGYIALPVNLVTWACREPSYTPQFVELVLALLDDPDVKAVLIPICDSVHHCGLLVSKDGTWKHLETFPNVVSYHLAAKLLLFVSCVVCHGRIGQEI